MKQGSPQCPAPSRLLEPAAPGDAAASMPSSRGAARSAAASRSFVRGAALGPAASFCTSRGAAPCRAPSFDVHDVAAPFAAAPLSSVPQAARRTAASRPGIRDAALHRAPPRLVVAGAAGPAAFLGLFGGHTASSSPRHGATRGPGRPHVLSWVCGRRGGGSSATSPKHPPLGDGQATSFQVAARMFIGEGRRDSANARQKAVAEP